VWNPTIQRPDYGQQDGFGPFEGVPNLLQQSETCGTEPDKERETAFAVTAQINLMRPENPSGNNYVLGSFRGLSRRGDGSERNSRAGLSAKRPVPAFECRERKNLGEDTINTNRKIRECLREDIIGARMNPM
jgi:hypothetical protein